MSCAGCEDMIPTILWVSATAVAYGYTPLPMTPTAGGGYSDPANVPTNFADPGKTRRISPGFFMTPDDPDGWDGYVTVKLIRLDVTPSPGSCHGSDSGSCEQLTSCSFDLVCTWEVLWASPGKEVSPVAPTVKIGSDPAQSPTVVGPVIHGDLFDAGGRILRWTSIDCQYVYTYSPGCGGSLPADFNSNDIVIGLPGFSPLGDPSSNEHIRIGFSCAKCQPSKAQRPGGDNQDTGKNANPNSINNI